MASSLDKLIEWLVDKVVSSGKDGVSLSQFLSFIDTFYDDLNGQTSGVSKSGASPISEESPKGGRYSESEVWRSFTSHPDVFVGEDKRGNNLDLGDIEALPHAVGESLERSSEDRSSPSLQLLEQLQSSAAPTLLAFDESDALGRDSAEVTPENDLQLISQSVELIGQRPLDRASKKLERGPRSPTRPGPKTDRRLITQPRIYVFEERLNKPATRGTGIDDGKALDPKSLAIPSKRRGRPPKAHRSEPSHRDRPPNIKANDAPRRRGRPPKARAVFQAPGESPLLPMPQEMPNVESSGHGDPVSLESPLEPQRSRTRQMTKAASFTSHDQSQRAAGIPGVYFDVVESKKTGMGRPKKRKIALFKSEKLKVISWMIGETEDTGTGAIIAQSASNVGLAIINDTKENLTRNDGPIKRKRDRDTGFEVANHEPELKKRLLDMALSFDSSRKAPYKSPYSSSPTPVYVSPYSTNPSAGVSLADQEGTSLGTPTVASIGTLAPLQSTRAKALSMTSNNRSLCTPMQPPGHKSLDQGLTSQPSDEQPLAIKTYGAREDDRLEAAIKFAGELAIPHITIRLAASKNGIAGNLCLSADKKSLTFTIETEQIATAPVLIQISEVVQPPEISTIDAKTAILQITTSRSETSEEDHQFRFFPTEAALRDANNMRAKIVTAMLLLDLEENHETAQIDKPFKCDGCDGTWKNMEGLKYHRTRSKTSCNPNYTPRKRKDPATHASQDILGLAAAALNVLGGDNISQPQNLAFSQTSQDFSVKRIPQTRSDPELQGAKEIILALLDANEKVFPSEKSLWYAFVAASLQKFLGSGLPDYGICNTALGLLVDTGQVRIVQFSFKDTTGLMKMRALVTKPDVDPTSAVVRALKENVKAMFPEWYIPPGFAPPKVVQSMLEDRQSRSLVADSTFTAQNVSPVSGNNNVMSTQSLQVTHRPLDDLSSTNITRSGRVSRRPQRLQQSILESPLLDSEEGEDNDGDSDLESLSARGLMPLGLDITKIEGRKKRQVLPLKLNPQAPRSAARSNIMDEIGFIPPQMKDDELQQNISPGHQQHKRRKIDMRPAEAVPNRMSMWRPAQTYLQCTNGSWSTATPPRIVKKYASKNGLPEPITYMQTLNNSAWSFRPYGHGVRPIHARPTKRLEGQTPYLTKIQHGFRPVIMPNGEIFIPTAHPYSTKDPILGTTKDGGSQPARRKRKYTRGSLSTPGTQGNLEEGLLQSTGSTAQKFQSTEDSVNTSINHTTILQPGAKQQRIVAPNRVSTDRKIFPEDGYEARRFSMLSDSHPLMDNSDQRVPSTSIKLGAEPNSFDDRAREEKAWDQRQKAPTAQYMMTSRRLTALPADVDGLEESMANYPDIKVEVAIDHQHSIRKRSAGGAISDDTDLRILIAVVIIRTLTGGLDKLIDWVLVSMLFPEYPINAVRKRWPTIHTKYRAMVERLETDFQELFLEAYEKGEASPIDYDHLVDYDWNSLIDLVLERIDVGPNELTTHRLPASRSSLNQMFTMSDKVNNKVWRDDFFGLQAAGYKRMEHAASEQHTMPISEAPPLSSEIDKFIIARSWARASTLTPSGSYDKDFAARKLATLPNGVVAIGTSSLLDSKVLMQRNKGRPTPNRGVEITDTFASALRKHIDETHLAQALAFKASLDARFRASEVVIVKWAATDGDVLAMTNLQAHGRIKLEPINVPMNRFGLTGGSYQTKRMDKANLRFDMQILPTPSYLYDADIPILAALTADYEPPHGGVSGATTVWYDIAENLMPALWKKIICVVLSTIAMRPGVVVKELVRIFHPAIEEWEMRILIEWGVRVGALEAVRDGGDGSSGGGYEGWTVQEWWWVIGGRAGS